MTRGISLNPVCSGIKRPGPAAGELMVRGIPGRRDRNAHRNRWFADSPLGAEWIRTSGAAREWLPFRFVYLPETVRVSPKGPADVPYRSFESTFSSSNAIRRLPWEISRVVVSCPSQEGPPPFHCADHCADDRQIGTGNQRKDLCPVLGGADLAVAAKPPDHIFSPFGGQAVGVETAVEIDADYNPAIPTVTSKTSPTPAVLPCLRCFSAHFSVVRRSSHVSGSSMLARRPLSGFYGTL